MYFLYCYASTEVPDSLPNSDAFVITTLETPAFKALKAFSSFGIIPPCIILSFLYSKNNNPIFIIKSFFPLVYINKNVGTNNNLEKAIDEHFNASIIKIEYN